MDHPSLGNFLDRLKNAQKSHDRTYEEYVMGKPPQKKRRKYLDADKRILNLVNSFEGRNTVQGRMEYLKGLAYNFVMDQ
ncbi:hypothetical protein DdX_19799 [Ditylenchus destructor]|uniref:Uncharacterized protein n=1 Tax=Ditylenchus destructor TaxID=166010 RepID=A0AAD4MHT3_9BILA|nr:hypothetical protein DdX_19799 [Ditylenchus destructor]